MKENNQENLLVALELAAAANLSKFWQYERVPGSFHVHLQNQFPRSQMHLVCIMCEDSFLSSIVKAYEGNGDNRGNTHTVTAPYEHTQLRTLPELTGVSWLTL